MKDMTWIWLPPDRCPDAQTTAYSALGSGQRNFRVVRFRRTIRLPAPAEELSLTVGGDTAFYLHLNGEEILRGPIRSGGDFLFNDEPRKNYYLSQKTLPLSGCVEARFEAWVRMSSVRICEYSVGHGGFTLRAAFRCADGSVTELSTDESWSCSLLGSRFCPPENLSSADGEFDASLPDGPELPAAVTEDLWHAVPAPIPPVELEPWFPEEGVLRLGPRETLTREWMLPSVCAGYLLARFSGGAPVELTVRLPETAADAGPEFHLRSDRAAEYEAFALHSCGGFRLSARNDGDAPTELRVGLMKSCYPAPFCARTETSDGELNELMLVCRRSLRWCRQSMHLDSPRHCEPLACTGDYYIASQATAFTFGDLRLAAFDVRRTAELLRRHDGRMFHTTYSLIWVSMLWDVYRYTGERALLSDCLDALELLLRRFRGYVGESGLIETPPDYMFVDWLVVDGYDLHHPPKALGQGCLNAFYYGALRDAEKICSELGDSRAAAVQRERAEALKKAFRANLWDENEKLFCEGLNTPTPEALLGKWMPANSEKRYFRRHTNILAAYTGLIDGAEAEALLTRLAEDDSLGYVQPYFLHFWLEAVFRRGQREKWTLPILSKWLPDLRVCPTGLPEGFYPPTPTYHFDRSHAWACTPAYALPLALSGLEILEPGMRRLALTPSLLGLKSADVEIPTPRGSVNLILRAGEAPVVSAPEGVEVLLRNAGPV